MKHTALLAAPLLASALALAACGAADKPEQPKAEAAGTVTATATATADTDAEKIVTEKRVVILADGEKGELGIDLPDGVGATVRLPADAVRKMGEGATVDIDGVGLYPGARITGMAISSTEKGEAKDEKVDIAFTAPSAPGAVADWYVAAFREKGHKASRRGNTVAATTTEGAAVAIDLTPDGAGTKGNIKVLESKKA
jgi:hypothetical protein